MVPYPKAVIIYPEEIEFPERAIAREHGVPYDGEGVAYISKLLLRAEFEPLENRIPHREVFYSEKDLSSFLRQNKTHYALVSKGWVWYALQVKQDTNFELGSFK